MNETSPSPKPKETVGSESSGDENTSSASPVARIFSKAVAVGSLVAKAASAHLGNPLAMAGFVASTVNTAKALAEPAEDKDNKKKKEEKPAAAKFDNLDKEKKEAADGKGLIEYAVALKLGDPKTLKELMEGLASAEKKDEPQQSTAQAAGSNVPPRKDASKPANTVDTERAEAIEEFKKASSDHAIAINGNALSEDAMRTLDTNIRQMSTTDLKTETLKLQEKTTEKQQENAEDMLKGLVGDFQAAAKDFAKVASLSGSMPHMLATEASGKAHLDVPLDQQAVARNASKSESRAAV